MQKFCLLSSSLKVQRLLLLLFCVYVCFALCATLAISLSLSLSLNLSFSHSIFLSLSPCSLALRSSEALLLVYSSFYVSRIANSQMQSNPKHVGLSLHTYACMYTGNMYIYICIYIYLYLYLLCTSLELCVDVMPMKIAAVRGKQHFWNCEFATCEQFTVTTHTHTLAHTLAVSVFHVKWLL